jgi:hypothetical protein
VILSVSSVSGFLDIFAEIFTISREDRLQSSLLDAQSDARMNVRLQLWQIPEEN